jgi:hypothetical protein
MITSRHLAAAFLGLLVFVLFGRASRAQLLDDPKELLERLKARDARFDNVHVSYIRRGVYTPPEFPYWKFPGQEPDTEPSKPMPFRFKEQVTVRGPDTTFVRDVFTTSLTPESASITFASHQKWSDADGLIREFRELRDHSDRLMEIKPGVPAGDSIVSGQRREVEFSLGLGFGRRIKTISSFTRKNDQVVLEGSIQIWSDDVSRYRMSLDEDLVVRSAVIEVESGGNQTRYDVSTKGSVKQNDFVFARTGHYTRTAMGLKNPPVKLQDPFKPHITDEFDIDFHSVKFHLEDEAYKILTNLDIPPGTDVMDHVTNRRYYVDQNNQTSRVSPLIPGRPVR